MSKYLVDHGSVGRLRFLPDETPNVLLRVTDGDPLPPPPPTPAPPPGWEILDGTGCQIAGDCAHSKNFPNNYGIKEHCSIEIHGTVKVKVEAFNTESNYDKLVMRGSTYSGTVAPPDGDLSGFISWASDYSETRKGWKLCRVDGGGG